MTHPPLYLLRHGQTDWNRDRRIQGQKESSLTDLGEAQAVQQGQILAALDRPEGLRAYCSPLRRTRQTAAHALAPLGLMPVFDDRLKEVGLGNWEGRLYAEVIAQTPALGALSAFDMCLSSPGETAEMLETRIAGFLDGLHGPSVIVSHGIALSVLWGVVLGRDRAGMAGMDRGQGLVIELRDGMETIWRAPPGT